MSDLPNDEKRKISLLRGITAYLQTCLSFVEGLNVSEDNPQDEGLRSLRQSIKKAKQTAKNELNE